MAPPSHNRVIAEEGEAQRGNPHPHSLNMRKKGSVLSYGDTTFLCLWN